MTELLLSSQQLENCNVLGTGELDLFELLQKQGNLDIVTMDAKAPKNPIILEWKEVRTPKIPSSFSDLAGKRLTEYKFQYLGRFSCGGEIITVEKEAFVADFPEQNISNSSIESTGWVNCTWLLDFVMNAPKIQEDSLRTEKLIWRKDKKQFVLSLSRETLEKKSAEQEKFVFSSKFETIEWEHHVLFSGQPSC